LRLICVEKPRGRHFKEILHKNIEHFFLHTSRPTLR
jgi:hypothetical protein